LIERSRIVLLAADGLNNLEIAKEVRIDSIKVGRWRKRFAVGGFAGIERDAYRPGRIPALKAEVVARVIEMTTHAKPRGATHWSAARLAKELGISESSVLRIWRANGLKPHQSHAFKVSNDPQFAEKIEDIVGLYLSQPEHAMVFCVDEKSQIQALDRTQPGLPMKRGRAGTMTTITNGTERRRSSPACPFLMGKSSGRASRDTRIKNGFDSSTSSTLKHRLIKRFISSPTTTPRINIPRFFDGSCAIVVFTCISHRRARHGSTWSNVSFVT